MKNLLAVMTPVRLIVTMFLLSVQVLVPCEVLMVKLTWKRRRGLGHSNTNVNYFQATTDQTHYGRAEIVTHNPYALNLFRLGTASC